MKSYNHNKIEEHWRREWLKEEIYKSEDDSEKKKFYHLVMFAYPSGDLHIGHWFNFAPADVIARKKRMEGLNVLSPFGFDAFGLPAENAAIKRKLHPKKWTYENISRMRGQLQAMGPSYDWSREVITADPEYYKWTQWMFLQLYKKGLAYRAQIPANWCPSCKTVLANEQVVDGKCERCKTEVVRRNVEQWMFKITAYADELLNDLDKLDWPEKTKIMQRNWIGRSEGAEIEFRITNHSFDIAQDKESRIKEFGISDTLKFRSALVSNILNGKKNATFRLEPKKLHKGDYAKLIDQSNGRTFAIAEITDIEERKLRDIPLAYDTCETYASAEERRKLFEKYYHRPVSDEDAVWIYKFKPVSHVLPVFTTRPDTIFGATYLVIAPEHEFISKNEARITNYVEVKKYVEEAAKKTEIERTSTEKEKTGVELKGIKAINPATGKEIPIWISDYVLGHYGTGAIMAVPAHDERDYAFAKKFNLPVIWVISGTEPGLGRNTHDTWLQTIGDNAYIGSGWMENSGQFNDIESIEALQKMTSWMENSGRGKKTVSYKLHDWIVSRQRYWGAPIPMVYCESCGALPVPEDQLPVLLPDIDDYTPPGDGKSPLARSSSFVNTTCPQCGGQAKRETDTMDTFVDSSWYFLRYTDPHNALEFASKQKMRQWLPVDLYIGGAEHTVMHLLYARFFVKALADMGYLEFREPFSALRHQGIILGEDNEKMSKSRGNVVDPDDLVTNFGADTVRMYLCFMGEYDKGGPWNPGGINGVNRFLGRVWKYFQSEQQDVSSPETRKMIHKTIKKIGEDIDGLKFNTAISALMICLRQMEDSATSRPDATSFLKLLAPFAPFMTEQIWRETLGNKASIHLEKWPSYDPALIEEAAVNLAVQINGKTRGLLSVPANIGEAAAIEAVKKDEKIKKYLEGKTIDKIFFVKNRLINLIIP
jgi:leucyl-tRNA synthetase